MTLSETLARARTEEDVKDAYIKALGLKGVFKGLVDIQTPEIWFEAKESPTAPLLMFAQLLTYVRAARKRGEAIPGFLCVIDREKAALMATDHALPLLDDKAIVWPKSGSAADKALAAQIAPTIETHFILYQIDGYEAEFIKAARDAVREGRIIRTPITPNNLRQVFDKWVAMVGVELGVKREADYAVLFFADIMHDGRNEAMRNLPARLLFSGDKPVFIIGGDQYELASERGYRNFWNIYHRPPEQKHRHYLLERRDSLLPMDDQKFKGAFYTPLHIVDKAYDQLNATLGADWQQKYIVWDMCAGVGNLEAKHSNLRNVFMSTLDAEDVTIMRSNPAFAGAEIFQYDYLNDDVTDFGEIDYSLSDKLPQALRQAIADAREGKKGAKPILVLINPPYGEAANSQGNAGKTGIAATRISHGMNDLGYAARELFVQFLHRIMLELPTAKLAMFSTLKYINAPNFSAFRERWQAAYLDGFVVHSKAFDGLNGHFPIGFLMWNLAQREPAEEVNTIAVDRFGKIVGEKKFIDAPNSRMLSQWLPRLPAKTQAIPLKNAIVPQNGYAKVSSWHDGAIAHMLSNSNDIQNAGTLTALFSSVYSAGNGYYVTPENLWQAAIVFSVRRLIKPTWLNDRDQFLQPSQPLSDEFKSDCLVWMLFNGSNLTAGADGLRWNDRDWSLTNHFIPFTESQVGAKARFESDFLVRYMQGMAFSPEAQAVMDEGRKLFARFHATRFPNKIREEYKLNRADAGWYQVRRALEAYGDIELTDFDPFKSAYAALTAKLRPMVYELGFLPE
ncbi:hypothetical protein [Porphyrobacter sp. MBR-155]|jgi:hypothetical protein|uniref:hypothetical protein n=1 Tax=Porphyrobacter sp. MBR-155 TaxID=3156464 RepID=UPI00339B2C88